MGFFAMEIGKAYARYSVDAGHEKGVNEVKWN